MAELSLMTGRLTLVAVLAASLAAGGCSGEDARVTRDGTAQSLSTAPREPAPTVGFDTSMLAEIYDSAATLPRLHSLLVARHGKLYGEEYYQGRTAQTRANVKSVSKSIVSTLVGMAVQEGKLSLDQPVLPFFAEYVRADSAKSTISIGNLLSMQAGLQPTSGRNYGNWVTSPNWVRYAITRPMADVPGGRMQYSTGSSHLLSAILTEATGMSTYRYAKEKLGDPLGLDLRPWTTDPQGIYFGGNEMRLTPRDMLTYGELYRNGGVHQGTRLLPEGWIENSWTERTQSRFNTHRYGYGWWIRESGDYRVNFAWGYGGQYIFIVPELELVVVTTSDPDLPREGDHNGAVHDLLDRIVIAAERGEGAG